MPKGHTIHLQQELVASAARTADGHSGNGLRVDFTDSLMLAFFVTAASGTNEGLGLAVQWSFDNSNYFTSHEIVRATTSGHLQKIVPVMAKYLRLAWAITGTSPSFTFKADVAWRE